MRRSSKSIVVKQRGGRAVLAACPPRARLAPAATAGHRSSTASVASCPSLPLRLHSLHSLSNIFRNERCPLEGKHLLIALNAGAWQRSKFTFINM